MPQGSILGPRQFSLYTAPLGKLILNLALAYHLYADDTQLLKCVNPKSTEEQIVAKNHLENSISNVGSWMYNNKLQLNKDKTEFLVIASPFHQNNIAVNHLQLEDDQVNVVDTARTLGVVMDKTLSMEQQVSNIRKSGFYYLRWTKSIRKFLTPKATETIVRALVINKIDYCNSILINLPEYLLDRLQNVMNDAARVVTCTPKRHK